VTEGHPDAADVAVALDALESDAVRWTDAAAQLRAAATAASAQVLPPGAFSFAGGEVAAAYERLRGRTAVLLREGAENLDAVAAALRTSAAAYAASDAAGVRRLDAVANRCPR
jgi:hypothetical protein